VIPAWRRGQLILTVRDTGVGFDPSVRPERSSTGGLGLDSMRERTELHDGVLTIDSAPGPGTSVTACWPLIEDPECVEKSAAGVNVTAFRKAAHGGNSPFSQGRSTRS
jgi:signal transduction histidine kinase